MNANVFFIVAAKKPKLTKTKTLLHESCVLQYLTPSWPSAYKKYLSTSPHVCTLEDIWCLSASHLNFLNFAGLNYSLNDSLTGFFPPNCSVLFYYSCLKGMLEI